MKKIILLLAVVAFVTTTSFVSSTNSTTTKILIASGKDAPEEVMATFNSIVTDVMNNFFPSNPSYDASAVNWTKDKREWICEGFVSQVGGNGSGINIISGRFIHSGEFIEVFYTITP